MVDSIASASMSASAASLQLDYDEKGYGNSGDSCSGCAQYAPCPL